MGGSGEDPLDSYNNCQNMRIDMADFRGDKKYVHYNFFMVRNAASKYKLQVAGYSRTARDNIQYGSGGDNLNGMAFSTPDRDNDLANVSRKGGWHVIQSLSLTQIETIQNTITTLEET